MNFFKRIQQRFQHIHLKDIPRLLLNKKVIIIVLVIGTGLFAYRYFPRKSVVGTIAHVQRDIVETTYSSTGKMMASTYLRPVFPKAAQVTKLAIRQGYSVKKGQFLIALKSLAFQKFYDIEKAKYQFKRTEYANRKAGNLLNEILLKKEAISREEYTRQKQDYFNYLEYTWKEHQKEWQKLQDIKALLNYRSAVNGYVSKIYVRKNQNIPKNSYLFEIINKNDIYIWLNVESYFKQKIVKGQEVRVAG